jgi:hypothetical protein
MGRWWFHDHNDHLRDRHQRARLLVDDFVIDHGIDGVTRVTGAVRDPAHLHGIVAHLTSVGAELISIGPSTTPEHTATELPDLHPSTTNETSNP